MPGRSRVPPWLWVLALALHAPLVWFAVSQRHPEVLPTTTLHPLAIGDSVRQVTLPMLRPDVAAPHLVTPLRARVVAVPLITPSVIPPAASIGAARPIAADTLPSGNTAAIRPRYGDGRLWVQPLVESPRTIAKALSGKTDKQLTDSAVASMVQTYLDAMAAEQAANPTGLPSWTTKIGGRTVGLDSKWIYLGPIKIPTMLLALLPINLQGNMSDYQYNKQLQSMRSDLFEAARRAATYDDFKKAMKDLHEQTEQRREFNRNQRTAPDTSHHG